MKKLEKISLAVCIVACLAGVMFLITWAHKTMDEKLSGWTERSGFRSSFAAAGVDRDDYERCLEWAFGEDILGVERRMWPDRWNQRHSDIFTMHGADDCGESLIAVGQAYLDRPLSIKIIGNAFHDWEIIDGVLVTDPNIDRVMLYKIKIEGGDGITIKDCNFIGH